MITIILASHNQNKVVEIQQMLKGSDLKIVSLTDLDHHQEIIENGETLEENALIKARTIASKYQSNVIGEDTGLEVWSLDMQPGVHTARYAGGSKDPDLNMEKLLTNLKDKENRKARFRTCIALVYQGEEYLFEGIVDGKIALEKSGAEGFGYDPIFIPEGYEQTFAEISQKEKNKISHRGKAMQKLMSFLHP